MKRASPARSHSPSASIRIACAPGRGAETRAAAGALAKPLTLVEGGEHRSDSVRNVVSGAQSARVLIHDAARPLIDAALIDRLLAGLDDALAAAPALPVVDALARADARGFAPVDRDALKRLQTPQGFHTDALETAFAAVAGRSFPDETALAHAAGLEVQLVSGDERAFKITWPEDFERAERLIADSGDGLTVTGTGYDVHRLIAGEGVTLCGVFIPCPLALLGHSDADAGLHAVTDALLGAAGLGDIGEHFPPSDPQWKGADSARFLAHAREIAAAAGATPVHADVTLICERPKIGPHKPAMKARLAELLRLPQARVNIKATTTEKLGFTGRGEGLAADAAVTVKL